MIFFIFWRIWYLHKYNVCFSFNMSLYETLISYRYLFFVFKNCNNTELYLTYVSFCVYIIFIFEVNCLKISFSRYIFPTRVNIWQKWEILNCIRTCLCQLLFLSPLMSSVVNNAMTRLINKNNPDKLSMCRCT